MKTRILSGASLLALTALSSPAIAQTQTPQSVLSDVIVVTGARIETETSRVQDPDDHPVQGADAAALIARTPGGALVGNGALSGQVQYRGLFGERLNLRVDGQSFASGGPNLMDPPFHYAPMPLLQAMEIDRGASPVSAGPGLAGGMNAVIKRLDYGAGKDFQPSYDFTGLARSVDESYSIGGIAGASNDTFRFNLLGSYEEGGDTDYPGGVIRDTSYQRGVFGLSTGVRTGNHEVGLDLRRQNTGPSGNPPFPMDIRFVDSDFARLTYAADIGDMRLEAAAHYSDVAHAMNNYDLRPAPMAAMQRETFANATTRGVDANVSFEALTGELQIGVDHELVDHDVTITNPNNAAFFIHNLPDIEQTRTGIFAEWTGDMGAFSGELGLRVDNHQAEAGLASTGPALPAGPTMLATAFNNADRSQDDTTVDALARLWMESSDNLTIRMNIGRKQKAPGYLERFGWLPTQASGGLADGNIYVGDLNLDPESMWLTEVGFDYRTDAIYLRPTVFYRQVDDYIQGVPFDATVGVIDTPVEMIANMNGDPTPLRFANVDAKLYGFDLDGGVKLTDNWRIDAVASYVRGERRDIDDNLYRIAPPSLTAGVTYEADIWSATFEARAVADQDDVSATNSEIATSGYAIFSLYSDWFVSPGVRLSAGVENLFDEDYADHLSGYNRNAASDVPLGERVPGAGRGAFIRLHIAS